jgi:AraC-like DNA-binding protein
MAAISQIPEVLRSLGADPADVCAAAGFDVSLFDDPTNLVTYRAASQLYRACVERTGCNHFGLLKGRASGLNSLGLVGILMKCAPDVGAALRGLVRFMHLNIRGAAATLREHGKLGMLGYEIHAPGVEAADQINDGALASAFNIMTALCGPQWKPVEVLFEHGPPPDTTPFHEFFRVPLRFGMTENALVFSASWLTRPLPPVERELSRLVRDRIAALEREYREDFAEQVRSLLRTGLAAGSGWRADEIARHLSMHSRTLHRRLAAGGTNFRALVDECRYQIAQQMLKNTDVDVGHIAYVLDYADATAFARAFRRWSGSSPSRWRDQARP